MFVLLINQFLFSLNVFEHVLAFWQTDIIGEDLRIRIVKLAQFRHPGLRLGAGVGAFEELVDIVQNQVVLEDGYDMGVLVVNQVVDNLDVVVVVVRGVLLRQPFLDFHLQLVLPRETVLSRFRFVIGETGSSVSVAIRTVFG